ncbi:MAG: hypothetical protein Q9166_002032 [cf. Caloplaca sp. 2 TL-2023]
MSQSPATPNKLSAEVTSASTVGPTAASGIMRSSLHEPSPASTYGETSAGDSIPATPQDVGGNDPSMALLDSLRSVTLNDSIDRDSGSPFPSRGSKSFARAEQRSVIGRDFAVPSGQSPAAKYSGDHSNATPLEGHHYEQAKQSPSWRHHGRFVRNCEHDDRDDPFVTSHDRAVGMAGTNVQGGFKPRKDRANLPLSADTAQAMLPPNACVFVAKYVTIALLFGNFSYLHSLTQSKSDDQLEHSVSEVFQAFGNVYVKIRRDNKGMPFAFCQYENVGDAQRAITMGRGLLIDGRACRTEVAKVNRKLWDVTGGAIPEDEARQVLSRFGAIEKLWYCSQTDLEMFRLPEGVWVMFAFFQDCRDAQAGFRDDPSYRLEQPKMPDDMRTRLNVRSGASPMHRDMPRFSPARYGGLPQAGMVRRAADLCSIFVGNLPPDATDDKLRELFGMYGRIVHIEIVRKPSVNGKHADHPSSDSS